MANDVGGRNLRGLTIGRDWAGRHVGRVRVDNDRRTNVGFKRTFNRIVRAAPVRGITRERRRTIPDRHRSGRSTREREHDGHDRRSHSAVGAARRRSDEGAHPGRRRGAVHGARLRGDQPAVDHRGGERQPRRGQLPLRQQGRAVPGGADAKARSDEPGARRSAARKLEADAAPRSRWRASRSWRRCSSPRSSWRATASAAATNFLRLLGRAYADPAPFIRQFLSEQYALMIARFKAAFGRALPQLPRKELSWRLHFIMGALSYTLAGTDALKLIAELSPSRRDNDEMLLRRLAPFLLAGLTAPLPDLSDVIARLDAESAAVEPARSPPSEPDEPGISAMLALLWFVVSLLAPIALVYVNASGVALDAAIAALLGAAWTFTCCPLARARARRRVRGPARSCCMSRRCAALFSAIACSRDSARCCRRCRRPSAKRSRPAPCGGTASCSPASPNWARLLAVPRATLTPEEQRFLDDEVETLCGHGHRLGDDERLQGPAAARSGSTSRTRASSA